MKKKTDAKDLIRITRLRIISTALIICTVLLLILNTILHIYSHSMETKRYELSYRATQFMNASAYLTSEVRAYAATGDQIHYENYWNEVNVWKNRDEGIAAMKEIGITKEEESLIDQMSSISDRLIPYEDLAMKLAKAGNTKGALDIVYGEYYNTKTANIRAIRDELRKVLDERTDYDMTSLAFKYNVVNIVTWLFAILVIMLQFAQKNILYRLAYVDQLTGSPNYYTFRQKMRGGIPIREKGYVIAMDLKDFSIINDVCGIEKGDEVIRELSETLKAAISPSGGEMSAHIVGDRFVMLMQCHSDDELIDRLRTLRAEIMSISEKEDLPYLMPTFGINRINSTSLPERSYGAASFANRLLRSTTATGFYSFFDQKMSETVLENRRMEDEFELALQKGQFEVWYQPKYSAKSGSFAAAEALVRWRADDGHLIPPCEFIPLFERNGMITQLDEYVFDRVCAAQKAWLNAGRKLVPISVNVSRATFLRTDIVERYIGIVKRHGISPEYIELELTESTMNRNHNTLELLKQFRAAGLHILVDDFGVGYSSLSTLVYSCFDGIKLDKSLADNIISPSGARLIEIITDLAHEFNMNVTAEGAETDEQAVRIKELSCDLIQGYCYSRPLSKEDFEKLLSQGR